jgi:hypothetical protein
MLKYKVNQNRLAIACLSSILNPGCGNALDKLPLT